MTASHHEFPRFPGVGAWALSLAPLAPLNFAAQRLITSLAARHPGLFRRLGEHADKAALIDPIDLPFVFRLQPDPRAPRLEARDRRAPADAKARIAGPLAALIGLVHGAYDGDALFFSRDLVIEGDTELTLALRNAIDSEELDLVEEVAALFGPLAGAFHRPLHDASGLLGRMTGVALTRPSPGSFAP